MASTTEYNPIHTPQVAAYANEFPPLSTQTVRPGQTLSPTSPGDICDMKKHSPEPNSDDEEEDVRTKKDMKQLIASSDKMIANGITQVRRTNAITAELISLLEHEKKILEQLKTRADKFKMLAEENKFDKDKWEAEYNQKLPEYSKYQDTLLQLPEHKSITVEGVPGPVEHKILFQIASKTINAINTVVVQLSLEDTLTNDIDFSTGSIKKKCSYMLKKVNGWLQYLKLQDCNQKLIIDRWELVDKTAGKIADKSGIKRKDLEEAKTIVLPKTQDGPMLTSQGRNQEEDLKEAVRRMQQDMCQIVCPYVCNKGKK